MSLSASVAVIVPIAVVFSATAMVPTAANEGALFAGGVDGGVGVELPPEPPPHDEIRETESTKMYVFNLFILSEYNFSIIYQEFDYIHEGSQHSVIKANYYLLIIQNNNWNIRNRITKKCFLKLICSVNCLNFNIIN